MSNIKNIEFDHVAFNVASIERSVEWYIKNLGCEIEYSDNSWAMLKCHGTKIALTLDGSHPPHLAFKFKMSSSAIFPCSNSEIKVHRDDSSYYYGSDPDGNIIEWVAYTNEEE